MLGHIPDGQNTLAYARISEVVIEGVPNNNCISEGSTPSDEGTGKPGLAGPGRYMLTKKHCGRIMYSTNGNSPVINGSR